jgi:hypothetical protein
LRAISIVEARIGATARDQLAGAQDASHAAGTVLNGFTLDATHLSLALALWVTFLAGRAIQIFNTTHTTGYIDADFLVTALTGHAGLVVLTDYTSGYIQAEAFDTFFAWFAFLRRLAGRRTLPGMTQ